MSARRFTTNASVGLVLSAAALIVAGCGDSKAKTDNSKSAKRDAGKTVVQNQDHGQDSNETAVAQTTQEQPVTPTKSDTATAAAPPKSPAVASPTAPKGNRMEYPASLDTVAALNEDDPNAKVRQQAFDMIYAMIRVEMEKAIEQRKLMLESGVAPSAVEVRDLEGKIMKAQGHLQEAGEQIDPVDPPIVVGG